MQIKREMINWLELLKEVPKGEGGMGGAILAPYMEYPTCKKCRYVQQWHLRGRSQHIDFRMEVNDHLVGWTITAPGGIPREAHSVEEAKKIIWKEAKHEFVASKKNRGHRAETKARQPKVWLTVEGMVKPGEVGATKTKPGIFVIVDKGQVYFGAQKPYFHEYFIKSDMGKEFPKDKWTRIVFRAVNVQVIDPETKRPRPGTELMWRALIPGDQTPYALKRGFKKKWVPPKGYIPIPPELRKGELYEKWLKWVKEEWSKKEEKKSEELAKAQFVIHYLSYMGQIVIRGIPHQRWFLRLKKDGKVYSWISDYDFTRFSPVAMEYEGVVDKKWFDYEGDIPPNTKYNPTKTLTAKMKIIDKGSCDVESTEVEGAEKMSIKLNGKRVTGSFTLVQEEKESPIYTIEKLTEDLEEARFVLQKHEIETPEGLKSHYDIRISKGFEFNIWGKLTIKSVVKLRSGWL